MIGKFIEIMKTGTNDYRPVIIGMEIDGVQTIVIALKHSMLLIEGDCKAFGTELVHTSKLPTDKAVRWDFEKDFAMLTCPKIVMNGAAREITIVNTNGDGAEMTFVGNDNNVDTMKTAIALIESTKKNLVGGGAWGGDSFAVIPGGAMEVDKNGNITTNTKDCVSFLEPSQVRDFLAAVTSGPVEIGHNSKVMVYVFKLADNVRLIEKSKIIPKKGTPKMSETQPAAAQQPQPQQAAPAPQPPQPQQAPPPQPAPQQPPQQPMAPQTPPRPASMPVQQPVQQQAPADAVKEPDIDDALNALSAIEDIVTGVKVQTRVVRAVLKMMSKKAPSKDLEAKYAELKKKIDNLKASL